MHDTYSYPLVWLLLLILVEKWFSNVIAHYDVFVAVILKAEKKIRCIHCSSQSPDSSTKYERIRKRKGNLFMTNKKQQLYLQINWDNKKALIDQKPIFYSKKNFFKKASIRFLSKYCVGYYPVNRQKVRSVAQITYTQLVNYFFF